MPATTATIKEITKYPIIKLINMIKYLLNKISIAQLKRQNK